MHCRANLCAARAGRSFSFWIYNVVRNRALKLRLARLRQRAAGRSGFAGDLRRRQGCNIARLPQENVLRRHLAGLAPKKRASLILAYVDGCTHREIAAQLGVPIGTAKAWIGRSLTALRAGLD
jgi:RNA polymerase sigma-70 factor (ECF subfamily)